MNLKKLTAGLAGILLVSTSYAALYVSPAQSTSSRHKAVNTQAGLANVVIGFANNIPLSRVVKSVYPGFRIKYWKIDPNQRLSWNWSGISKNESPLQYMQTAYHIYVYGNKSTKAVGVSKDLAISKALTRRQKSVWELRSGRNLRTTLNKWAKSQHSRIIWKVKSNPRVRNNKVILGTFPYALNYSVINEIRPKGSAVVMRSKSGRVFYVEKVEKIRALYAPKLKGYPSFVARNGMLWANVKKFARQFHYKLKWNVVDPETQQALDWPWVGDQKIVGRTPLDILKKMLSRYPVIVNVWKGNRVIEVDNARLS